MKRWLAALICVSLFLTSTLPGLAEEIETSGDMGGFESVSSVESSDDTAERDISSETSAEENDSSESSADTDDWDDNAVKAEAEASEEPEVEATNEVLENGEDDSDDDTNGADSQSEAQEEPLDVPAGEVSEEASETEEAIDAPAGVVSEEDSTAEVSEDITDEQKASEDDTADPVDGMAEQPEDIADDQQASKDETADPVDGTAEMPEDTSDDLKASEDDTADPVDGEAGNASVESKETEKDESIANLNSADASPEVPAADAEKSSKTTRIAILSDIHYVTDQLISEAGKANVDLSAKTEVRLMEEIDAIVSSALKDAAATNPDVMVVCGDLVSNGELLGARALAEKLKGAKSLDGMQNTGIYVVNGNHDINNSYAVDFTGETVKNAQRVQPEDFSEIFSGLGYGEDDHYEGGTHSVYVPTDDPTVITNHGGLSYATEVADGITLIVLDTAIYRTDKVGESQYNEAQKTGGYVSDDLLNWAKTQAEAARENGNLVLAMCHHAIVPHFDLEYMEDVGYYNKETIISNWENVADTLADAGVTAVLTGHFHTNDISKHVSKNNNVLYDIETAALSAYPCAWRTLDITTNGEGENKTYTFSVNTSNIDGDLGVDTSTWTFTIGGETHSFDDYYGKDLQKYAYDKTGITETSAVPMVDYLVKSYLYDIVNHEGGIAGFIGEKLGLEEGQTLGDYALSAITKQLGKLSNLAQEFTLLGNQLTLKTGEVQNIPEADATDEALAKSQPTLNLKVDSALSHEEADVSIDLSYIRTAVGEFMGKVQDEITKGEWMKNPYASAPLLKDISGMLEKGLLPALTKPIEGADTEYDSALKMLNDAYQADADGDEGLADEATQQRWQKERELLMSESLSRDIVDGLTQQVTRISDYSYPAIYELLKSQRLVAEGTDSIIKLDVKESGMIMGLATGLLSKVDTLASLPSPILSTLSFAVKLPTSLATPIQKAATKLHESKTSDHNILHDTTYDFHTVRFDANGGKVSQPLASTLEDNKIVNLPEPEARPGYTFDGWFTAPEGGDPVSMEDDMSNVDTVYAHWTYVGIPDDGTDEDEDEADEDDDNGDDSSNDTVVEGLHLEFFDSIQAAHDTIHANEASNPEHDAFCDRIAAQLTVKTENAPVVDMGEWLSLNDKAVKAIEAYGSDVVVLFACQGVHFRCVIPAGFDFESCTDEDGCICVFCLAEAVGYERIGNA